MLRRSLSLVPTGWMLRERMKQPLVLRSKVSVLDHVVHRLELKRDANGDGHARLSATSWTVRLEQTTVLRLLVFFFEVVDELAPATASFPPGFRHAPEATRAFAKCIGGRQCGFCIA